VSSTAIQLKNAPDSSDLREAIKDYDIPANHAADGVRVPLSPVVIVDPSSDPARLVPQGWWLYQGRRVNTSGGAGALVTRIQIPTGCVAKLVRMYVQFPASAGSTSYVRTYDEDGAQNGQIAGMGAGANTVFNLPTGGATPTSTGFSGTSVDMMIGPGEYLSALASTSLVTETLTIGLVLLLSSPTEPIWDITGSVGGSALADSTISAANTLQKVDLPW